MIKNIKHFFDLGFTKKQFDLLVWPDSKFIRSTAIWVAFLIVFLMCMLNFVLDPFAMNIVMMFKQ